MLLTSKAFYTLGLKLNKIASSGLGTVNSLVGVQKLLNGLPA